LLLSAVAAALTPCLLPAWLPAQTPAMNSVLEQAASLPGVQQQPGITFRQQSPAPGSLRAAPSQQQPTTSSRLRWRVRSQKPQPQASAQFTHPVRLVNNEEFVAQPAAAPSRSRLQALQPVSSGQQLAAPSLTSPSLTSPPQFKPLPASTSQLTPPPAPPANSLLHRTSTNSPAAVAAPPAATMRTAAPVAARYSPAVSAPGTVRATGSFGTPAPAYKSNHEVVDDSYASAPALPELTPAAPSSRRSDQYDTYQLAGEDDSKAMDMDMTMDDADRAGKFADCPNKFNDRNCCEDGDTCNKSRELRAGNSITKISLNITPLFKPDAAGDIDLAKEQSKGLKKTTSRSWTDRSGSVIANGRFENYRDGRVVVMTDHGLRQQIPFYSLSDTDMCYVDAWWGLPTECTLGDVAYQSRNFMPSTFTWKASALCHKPLYFEERALERYGHSAGPLKQPLISGAHFFLNLVTVPYQMGIHPPMECQYALGYYRPGSCAPWMIPAIPLSPRGAAYQAGAVMGGIFLLP